MGEVLAGWRDVIEDCGLLQALIIMKIMFWTLTDSYHVALLLSLK
jgi:hypothetical protein